MKIEKISLTNFRCKENLLLNMPEKITVIHGDNAKGKSTIKHAIAFAFTGRNEITDFQTRKLEDLITYGQTNSLVSIKTTELGTLTRTIPHTVKIQGIDNKTISGIEEYICNTYKVNFDQILSCIYSNKFVNLDSNAKKDFIFGMVNFTCSEEIIKQEFMAFCREIPIEEDIIEQCWNYITEQNRYNFENIEALDEILDDFQSLNRSIKRELKRLEMTIKSFKKPELPKNIPIEKYDDVVAQIKKYEAQKDDLLKIYGNYERIAKRKEELDIIIAKQGTLKVSNYDEKELKNIIKKAEENKETTYKKVIELKTTLNNNNKIIKELSSFKGVCPVSNALKCNLKVEEVNKIIEKLQKENEKNTELLKKEETQLNLYISTINNNRKLLEEKLNYIAELTEINNAIKEAEKYKTVSKDLEETVNKLNTLNEKIRYGDGLLQTLNVYKETEKQEEELKNQYQDYKNKNISYDIIISAFKTSGIKSNILLKTSKPFEEAINNTLKLLTNGRYSITFDIEEDFDIYIKSDNVKRKLNTLSSSEMLRVSIAIQDAISQIIGLKLLICDDIEMLDVVNRDIFLDCINKIKDKYDSIIIILTGRVVKLPHANIFNMNEL